MLDYKDIIIKHYVLHMSGRQIAAALGVSKSGVNALLKRATKHYVIVIRPKEVALNKK